MESFASESASFDLSNIEIAGCIKEIDRAMGYLQANPYLKEGSSIKDENLVRLKSIFLNLEEYILRLGSKTAYMGEFMMEIFRKGASITHANHHLFITEVQKVMDVFMEISGGSNSRGAPWLEHFVQCLKRVYGEPTEARCLAKAKSYRVHVSPKGSDRNGGHANYGNNVEANLSRTVSYWCFAPAEAMRDLASLKARSIIVTSGTLSPLESYAMELGLRFPHRLENPHIIADDQIYVRVVGKGVSGKNLCSSYERRKDAEYHFELGNTLVSLSKVTPGGMLVFFPSYGVMEACLERWGGPASSAGPRTGKGVNSFFAARRRKNVKVSSRYSFPFEPKPSFIANKVAVTPWKQLLATKAAVVEPKATSDLPDAIAEFHKYLAMPKSKGCLLFGVCRGKISEGIDFADEMCRAVVITGLPFAPAFDPKVKMKREFLDSNIVTQRTHPAREGGFGGRGQAATAVSTLSGHEWYTQQAHRAVNQAIGRVIRNKDDFGAILLLDSRFGLSCNQQGLSKWVRPHIQNDEGVGRTIGSLVKFFKSAEQKARGREHSRPPARAPNDVSIILGYEEEEGEQNRTHAEEDAITKVAIIQKPMSQKRNAITPSNDAKPKETSPYRSYIPPERILARMDVETLQRSQDWSVISTQPETM